MSPIENILHIKHKLHVGDISLAEAKEQSAPFIDILNAKSREIAKKHGVKPKLCNASSMLR